MRILLVEGREHINQRGFSPKGMCNKLGVCLPGTTLLRRRCIPASDLSVWHNNQSSLRILDIRLDRSVPRYGIVMNLNEQRSTSKLIILPLVWRLFNFCLLIFVYIACWPVLAWHTKQGSQRTYDNSLALLDISEKCLLKWPPIGRFLCHSNTNLSRDCYCKVLHKNIRM